MNEELKPCPFCGGKAVIEDSLIKVDGCFIGCTKYGCRGTVRNGVLYPDKEAAVIAWNTRYEPTCNMEPPNRKTMPYPACSACGAPMLNAPNRFCAKCGAKVDA